MGPVQGPLSSSVAWIVNAGVSGGLLRAPRLDAEISVQLRPGDLIEFEELRATGPVVLRDLVENTILACWKLGPGGRRTHHGWVLCHSQALGVHFSPSIDTKHSVLGEGGGSSSSTARPFDGPAGSRTIEEALRLNKLQRYAMPPPPDRKPPGRVLLQSSFGGRFSKLAVCDCLLGSTKLLRSCIGNGLPSWLNEHFAVDVEVLSLTTLQKQLSSCGPEKGRLVLLLFASPAILENLLWQDEPQDMWPVRWKGSLEGSDLQYLASNREPSVEQWLQGPVECNGTVHLHGLASIWAWSAHTGSAAALSSTGIAGRAGSTGAAFLRVEDFLFNSHGLAEALIGLGFDRRDSARPVCDWEGGEARRSLLWHYSRLSLMDSDEKAELKSTVRDFAASVGYTDPQERERWSEKAKRQLAALAKESSPGPKNDRPASRLRSSPATELRIDPEDGECCSLARMCQKYAGSWTRQAIEQYFLTQCELPGEKAEYEGCWNYGPKKNFVRSTSVQWESGLVTPIKSLSPTSFSMELDGALYRAHLEEGGKKLVFSDGDVWTRALEAGDVPAQGHPQLLPEFNVGDSVLYRSGSVQKWVKAVVRAKNPDGTYELNVKKRARADLLRAVPAGLAPKPTTSTAHADPQVEGVPPRPTRRVPKEWDQMLEEGSVPSRELELEGFGSVPRVVGAIASAMFRAIENGDVAAIQRGIHEVRMSLGKSALKELLSAADHAGNSLLHRCAAQPSKAADMARALLEARADPNGLPSQPSAIPTLRPTESPLVAAAKAGNAEICRLLLDFSAESGMKPADVAAAREEGDTKLLPLLVAASRLRAAQVEPPTRSQDLPPAEVAPTSQPRGCVTHAASSSSSRIAAKQAEIWARAGKLEDLQREAVELGLPVADCGEAELVARIAQVVTWKSMRLHELRAEWRRVSEFSAGLGAPFPRVRVASEVALPKGQEGHKLVCEDLVRGLIDRSFGEVPFRLDGIRLLLAGVSVAFAHGPLSRRAFANLGADVVQLNLSCKPLDAANDMRQLLNAVPVLLPEAGAGRPPLRDLLPEVVAVDLRTEVSQQVFRQVLRCADVIIHDITRDPTLKPGLDLLSLLGDHKDIVVVGVSGQAECQDGEALQGHFEVPRGGPGPVRSIDAPAVAKQLQKAFEDKGTVLASGEHFHIEVHCVTDHAST